MINPKIRYKIVDEERYLSEKELNDEYGVFGWQLISIEKFRTFDLRYTFSRNEIDVLRIFFNPFNERYYFHEGKYLEINWFYPHLPNIGEEFNPIDFLFPEEIYKIAHKEEWLTPAGADYFREKKYNDMVSFLGEILEECYITKKKISYDKEMEKYIVNIWVKK